MSGGITVRLKECRNVHSTRGDKFTGFARLEHGGSVMGEGGRVEYSGGETMTLDLEATVPCSANDVQSLVNVTKYPLIVNILEVLPKDKKAKEEKTAVLGQASLDLLPTLLGTGTGEAHTPSQLTLTLHTITEGGGATSTDSSETAAEIDLEVYVARPIFSGEQQLTKCNVLSLRARSLHSLPDSWQPGTFPYTFSLAMPLANPPSSATSAPNVSSSRGIVIPQGALKLCPDKDHSAVSAQWRWPHLPGVTTNASLVEGCPMESRPLEEEVGQLNTKQDAKFRLSSECDKPRVSWNTQHRSWLPSLSTQTFLEQLSQCSLWPVEVGRFTVPATGGKGKAKEEEPVLSHHAVAYVNLAPLLYPGVTQICGAYPLVPFSEADILDKTKYPHSSLLVTSTNLAPAGGNLGAKGGKNKRTASSLRLQDTSSVLGDGGTAGGVAAAGTGEGEGGEGGTEVPKEGQVYVDAKTYVYLEIELQRPLIPRRPASVLAQRISEYIPPRPPVPHQVGGAERAVLEFHSQTANIANMLLEQFRELYGEELTQGDMDDSQKAIDERRRKLLFHLNSSGKYHTFKEQLKQSVVRIVREKYLNQAKTADKAQLQNFLSELYVFLSDQMHAGLNKVISLEDATPPAPSVLDAALLKHFAFEAEEGGDYELADRYYKERVGREDHVAELWYDYGVFSLLTSDVDKSEQCFKEAIALNRNMVPALLLYGMLCCLDERYSEAGEFFELATTTDQTSVIAWTIRGLYYEHACNAVYQEMCFHEACKLNQGHSPKTFIAPSRQGGVATQQSGAVQSTNLANKSAITQSKVSVASKPAGGGANLKQASGGSIGKDGVPQVLVESTKSVNSTKATGLEQQERRALASGHLSTVISEEPLQEGGEEEGRDGETANENNDESGTGGQTQALQDTSIVAESPIAGQQPSLTGATQQPSTVMTGAGGGGTKLESGSGSSLKSGQSAADNNNKATNEGSQEPQGGSASTMPSGSGGEESTASIFLQTAAYLLDVHALKFAEMCLAHELTSPEGGPSTQFHIAEARLHLHRKSYQQAEECLRKAITSDIQDANAWALLGHTHYLTGDYSSAKDAYERTISYVHLPAHVHIVYLRLADIYLKEKEYIKAKETYLRACRKTPSSQTWRGVGVACYHLNDLAQAEDALCEANILNNLDSTVWAYLTLVCLKTNRLVEAEQAFKFAIKTGLGDDALLSEISQLQKTLAPNIDVDLSLYTHY